MDTKKIIIGVVAFIMLAGAGGAAYFLLPEAANDKYADAILPRDFSGRTVEPVEFPMKGYTFVVPTTGTSTTQVETDLNLVAPSATHNYPMGRFTLDGVSGTLFALDNFTTDTVGGRVAVPIAVTLGSQPPMYYLAILESVTANLNHVASLPLDEAIRIREVSVEGSQVSVQYQTHARGQDLAEVPTESTTAILDMARAVVVQKGRQPRLEVVDEYKSFSGVYEWQATVRDDGTIVEPVAPGEFTLLFDGPRVRLETDCNSGSADLTTSTTTRLTIGAVTATQRFCTSEQEDEYFAMVSAIEEFEELANGGYSFALTGDSGVMTFVPENTNPNATLPVATTTSTETVDDQESAATDDTTT